VLKAVALSVLAVFASLAACSVAWAEEVGTLQGKLLTIEEAETFHKILKVGGETVLERPLISVERIFHGKTRDSAIIAVSDGGNMCPAQYLVLSVIGDTIEQSDEVGNCSPPNSLVGPPERVQLTFSAYGNVEGEEWVWTPGDGMKLAAKTTAQPVAGTGWFNARDLLGQDPAAIFMNEEVSAAIKRAVGDAYPMLVDRTLVATPIAEVKPGILFGSGCMPHACDSDKSFVGLDLNKKQVFVGLKLSGKPVEAFPKQGWPPALLQALRKAMLNP